MKQFKIELPHESMIGKIFCSIGVDNNNITNRYLIINYCIYDNKYEVYHIDNNRKLKNIDFKNINPKKYKLLT